MGKIKRYKYSGGLLVDKLTGKKFVIKSETEYNYIVDAISSGIVPKSMVG